MNVEIVVVDCDGDTGPGETSATVRRQQLLKDMIAGEADPVHLAAIQDAEAAELKRESAESYLAKCKELLKNAPSTGVQKNLDDAQASVIKAEHALDIANNNLKEKRGDFYADYADPRHVKVKNSGSALKWTSEKLAELAAYRDSHSMPDTVAKFGLSEQRIRQLLPRRNGAAKPFDGLIHRNK